MRPLLLALLLADPCGGGGPPPGDGPAGPVVNPVAVTEGQGEVIADLRIGMWGNQATELRARNAEHWIESIFSVDASGNRHVVARDGGACMVVRWNVEIFPLHETYGCADDNEADTAECVAVHRQVGRLYRSSWKIYSSDAPGSDTMWSNFREGATPAHGAFSNWWAEENCTPSYMPCAPWNGNAWAHEAGHLMGLDHNTDGRDLPDDNDPANIMSTSPGRRRYVRTDDVVRILQLNTGDDTWRACDACAGAGASTTACSQGSRYTFDACGRRGALVEACDGGCRSGSCFGSGEDPCSANETCGDCVRDGVCGWCDGQCTAGSDDGADGAECRSWDWDATC